MALDPIEALRDIALAFPEVLEDDRDGGSAFRVRRRIFASVRAEDGVPSLTVKAAPGQQEVLVADGEPYFLPDYLATHGWVGVRLGPDTDWREVSELVTDSYREVAPRDLARGIGLSPGPSSLGAQAMIAVGNVIGELIEGKPPRDEVVAEAEADGDLDDGLILDPEDPRSSIIDL